MVWADSRSASAHTIPQIQRAPQARAGDGAGKQTHSNMRGRQISMSDFMESARNFVNARCPRRGGGGSETPAFRRQEEGVRKTGGEAPPPDRGAGRGRENAL